MIKDTIFKGCTDEAMKLIDSLQERNFTISECVLISHLMADYINVLAHNDHLQKAMEASIVATKRVIEETK